MWSEESGTLAWSLQAPHRAKLLSPFHSSSPLFPQLTQPPAACVCLPVRSAASMCPRGALNDAVQMTTLLSVMKPRGC